MSSRSLLARLTLPLANSSASSDDDTVRAATMVAAWTLKVAFTGAEVLLPVSVTVRVTVWLPAAAYACCALAVGAVVLTIGDPSPKLKW